MATQAIPVKQNWLNFSTIVFQQNGALPHFVLKIIQKNKIIKFFCLLIN